MKKALFIGFLVIVIANTGCSSKDAKTSSPSQTVVNSGSQASVKADFIKPGMYKVGSEIAAGEYVVEATGSLGYFQISSDSSGEFDSIIVNDTLNRDEFGYAIIQDGDYIQLQNCRMYVSNEKTIQPKDLGKIPASTYKIRKGSACRRI